MKNLLIQKIGKNVIVFSAMGIALLLGACSSDSSSNTSSGNNGTSGDNGSNAAVSDWTYIINHPQEGFVMKALFNDGVTETYTCRPGGLCDISFSDGSGTTTGLTYRLTKMDDNRAIFYDVQPMEDSAQAEDTFDITHDATTGKCTAVWTEKYTDDRGKVSTDRENNIVITFERM